MKTLLTSDSAEWIILDWGSRDGLLDFIRSTPLVESRQVVIIHEPNERGWHASIAKNKAHKSASGKILVNLDCDNLISNSLEIIQREFAVGVDALHLWSGIARDGTFGRIALYRNVFRHLGGYDESLMPAAYEDYDLLNRAAASSYRIRWQPCPKDVAIRNSRKDTIANCITLPRMNWRAMHHSNRRASEHNIITGRLIANQ